MYWEKNYFDYLPSKGGALGVTLSLLSSLIWFPSSFSFVLDKSFPDLSKGWPQFLSSSEFLIFGEVF